MEFQITSLTIVYSTVYWGADQRKHQSSASLASGRGIHRWSVNSPHKGPVMRKMFPFDDVIMRVAGRWISMRARPTCMLYDQQCLKPMVTEWRIYAKNWATINTLRLKQNGRRFSRRHFQLHLWMEIYMFRLKFHWSLFPMVQLTTSEHWFSEWLGAGQVTSHYLNQWWLVYWWMYTSLGRDELTHDG